MHLKLGWGRKQGVASPACMQTGHLPSRSPDVSQGHSEVKYFLHNHLRFTILFHKDAQTDLARIVGFEVEPFSVKHEYEAPWDKASPVLNTCNPGRMIYVTHDTPPQPVQEGAECIFSYDVKFVVSGLSPGSQDPQLRYVQASGVDTTRA